MVLTYIGENRFALKCRLDYPKLQKSLEYFCINEFGTSSEDYDGYIEGMRKGYRHEFMKLTEENEGLLEKARIEAEKFRGRMKR